MLFYMHRNYSGFTKLNLSVTFTNNRPNFSVAEYSKYKRCIILFD